MNLFKNWYLTSINLIFLNTKPYFTELKLLDYIYYSLVYRTILNACTSIQYIEAF